MQNSEIEITGQYSTLPHRTLNSRCIFFFFCFGFFMEVVPACAWALTGEHEHCLGRMFKLGLNSLLSPFASKKNPQTSRQSQSENFQIGSIEFSPQ